MKSNMFIKHDQYGSKPGWATLVLVAVIVTAIAVVVSLVSSPKVPTVTSSSSGPLEVKLLKDHKSYVELRIENKACYGVPVEMTAATHRAGKTVFQNAGVMKNEQVDEINLPLKGNGSEITIVAKAGFKTGTGKYQALFPDQTITIKR